jgi:undecaprenyl-diphosphooligosaccharide---protein glycotransferase
MIAHPAEMPRKTREVYYYLPLRMMEIFPTVQLFSNLDLQSGMQRKPHFFYSTQYFRDTPQAVQLGNGILLKKGSSSLSIGDQTFPIRNFYKVEYDRSGKLQVDRQLLNFNANMSVIYMASYKRFIVLDEALLNSAYIQLFVFENYDPKYFEPVILDPYTKIFRLKI